MVNDKRNECYNRGMIKKSHDTDQLSILSVCLVSKIKYH